MMMLAYVVDRCGYSCDYCYNVRPRTGAVMDLKALGRFVDQVSGVYGREVMLDLIGGEVTEHPGLLEFAASAP
jgi:sulfatase maturation enzyme AslB (radical SAM superfamily)